MSFPAIYDGQDATAVFAIRLPPGQTLVRTVIVAEESDEMLWRPERPETRVAAVA